MISKCYVTSVLRSILIVGLLSSIFVSSSFSVETDDSTFFLSGFNAYHKQNYAKAITDLNELLRKYPESQVRDMALFWLARAYYKNGDLREAARSMSQFAREYPENPLRATAEADLLALTDQYDKGADEVKGAGQVQAQQAKPTGDLPQGQTKKERLDSQTPEDARLAQEAAAKQAKIDRGIALLVAKERIDAERVAKEKLEQEQAAREQLNRQQTEKERVAKRQADQERLAGEKSNQEELIAHGPLGSQQAEKERSAKLLAEQERLAAERAEKERVAKVQAEQAAREQLIRQQAENERVAKLRAEQERLDAIKAEQERLAVEQAEKERVAKVKAEQERKAAEQAAREQLIRQQAENERVAKLRAEQERLDAIKVEQERLAVEQAEKERIAKEKAEQAEKERVAKVNAEQERLAAEQTAREQFIRQQAENERVAKLRAEQERLDVEKAELERLAVEQAEKERIAKVKAEQERLTAEQAAREQLIRQQAENERVAKLQAEQKLLEAKKAELERLAAEQAEKERVAKATAEQDRMAHEQKKRAAFQSSQSAAAVHVAVPQPTLPSLPLAMVVPLAAPSPGARDVKHVTPSEHHPAYALVAGESSVLSQLDPMVALLSSAHYKPVITNKRSDTETYLLTVGCYGDREEALQKRESLVNRSDQAFVIKNEERYCVATKTFVTENEANKELGRLEAHDVGGIKVIRAVTSQNSWVLSTGHYSSIREAVEASLALERVGVTATIVKSGELEE